MRHCRKGFDDARALAEEALALHLEGLAEDGEAEPEPSSLEQIMADPDNRDGVAILVAVPQSAAKAIRINITVPEDILGRIDRHAEREGMTLIRLSRAGGQTRDA